LSLPSHPVELLLQAFDIVHAEVPESVLLLVGGGEQFETLRVQAQSPGKSQPIRFTGRVSPSDIPAYYRLAEVVVDPVHDDAIARGRLPLKMLESWISEVPFVSANVGDRKTLLGDPPAGLLARPGDAGDLARCIQSILVDGVLASELRKRGLKQARVYSWRNVTQEIIYVMERFTQK
jgi:glycosyltransferase involved in cell wall biosynthesis